MARLTQLALLTTVSFALIFAVDPGTATGSPLRLAQGQGSVGILPLEVGAIPGAPPAFQDQSAGAVLTNADVIKMVQAHLSADIVVSQIQSSACRFSLTPSSLIGLKQAGVPDKVIAAMQAKGGVAATAGPTSTPHAPNAMSAGREYTVPEFERLLPGILSKAAVAHGLNAHDYDKEAAYVGEFLATCALDNTNVRVQMPNPRLPEYEICQRSTAAHTHIEGMLDVSVASQSWHSEDGTKRVARGDVLMDVGIPPTGRWSPGEKYSITLKVLVDRAPNRLDDVVSNARIKGHAPKSSETGATSSAPPANSPATPAKPATPYPVFDLAASPKDFDQSPAYELGLLYIRRVPSVLDDPRTLKSFIQLVSCGDVQVARQMMSEFDAPRVSAYYRSNEDSFLSDIPAKMTLKIGITLGEYDFANSYFPFRTNGPLLQQQTALHPNLVQRPTSGFSLDRVDYSAESNLIVHPCHADFGWPPPSVNQDRTVYEVAFDPISIDKIALDQTAARSYIQSHLNRAATLVVEIQLSDDAPKIYPGVKATYQRATVVFAGQVNSITLYDSYPSGKVIETLNVKAAASPGSSGSLPASGGAETASPAGPANNYSSSTPGSATADASLPVPVIRDGVAGKLLQDYLNKCLAGDSKGCEMVGFHLEKGRGTDRDLTAAKAYYEKACSMGRKDDCGR